MSSLHDGDKDMVAEMYDYSMNSPIEMYTDALNKKPFDGLAPSTLLARFSLGEKMTMLFPKSNGDMSALFHGRVGASDHHKAYARLFAIADLSIALKIAQCATVAEKVALFTKMVLESKDAPISTYSHGFVFKALIIASMNDAEIKELREMADSQPKDYLLKQLDTHYLSLLPQNRAEVFHNMTEDIVTLLGPALVTKLVSFCDVDILDRTKELILDYLSCEDDGRHNKVPLGIEMYRHAHVGSRRIQSSRVTAWSVRPDGSDLLYWAGQFRSHAIKKEYFAQEGCLVKPTALLSKYSRKRKRKASEASNDGTVEAEAEAVVVVQVNDGTVEAEAVVVGQVNEKANGATEDMSQVNDETQEDASPKKKKKSPERRILKYLKGKAMEKEKLDKALAKYFKKHTFMDMVNLIKNAKKIKVVLDVEAQLGGEAAAVIKALCLERIE